MSSEQFSFAISSTERHRLCHVESASASHVLWFFFLRWTRHTGKAREIAWHERGAFSDSNTIRYYGRPRRRASTVWLQIAQERNSLQKRRSSLEFGISLVTSLMLTLPYVAVSSNRQRGNDRSSITYRLCRRTWTLKEKSYTSGRTNQRIL